ncbi:hypothetical protein CEXT_319581 [Caerostris extrusa]|uniref:Uncharacterized protein n=1 Tax=Caerostris extrusa TaxID=172846 RepID=A0AAV4WWA1_CAEEX|nr:hypothetical protein CEXT_319581 [Caerostris extrusa]
MTQAESDNVYQEGFLQPKKWALEPKCHLLIRSRFERERKWKESVPPQIPLQIEFIPLIWVSHLPHFILISFLPTLFSLRCLRERQGLSFRIEIGLKGPQATKVPLLSEGFSSVPFSPKVGHCIFYFMRNKCCFSDTAEDLSFTYAEDTFRRLLLNKNSFWPGRGLFLVFANEFKVEKIFLHQNPSNPPFRGTSVKQTESDNVYQEGLLQPNKEMSTRAQMPFY